MGSLEGYEMGSAEFLFPPAGYLAGSASVFDMGGMLVLFNVSPTSEAADKLAIAQDWLCVGDALRTAIGKVAEEQKA